MFHHTNDVQDQKGILFVTIFGPYQKEGLSRLEKLRDYLRSIGYSNTFLVKDLPDPKNLNEPDPDTFFTKKSLYYLQRCNTALFIFFKDVVHGSVTVEMTSFLNTRPGKINCASFFIEEGMKLETLEKGILRINDCKIAYFETEDDLNKLSGSSCLHHLLEDKCHETNGN